MALVPVVQPESAASAPRTHARLPAVGTGRPPCGQGRPGHLHPRPDHRQGPGQGRRDRRTHRGDDHPGLQGHPGVPSRGHRGHAGCEIPTTDRPSPPLAEMAQAWGVQVTYGPMPADYLGWGGSYRPMGNGPSPRSGSSSPRSRWSPWWSSPPSVAPASVFCEVDFSALDGPALQAFCALHPVAPRQGPRRLHLSPTSTPPILFLVAPTYRFASCGQSGRVRVHGGQELHSISGRSKTTLLYFPRGPQLNCEKCHSFLEECACCGQESRDGLCGCGGPICEGCTEAFCVEAWGMAEAVA